MRVSDLLGDDGAASPVIGVILMAAITVVLASVLGTFVLGTGEALQETAPQAQFGFAYESGGSSSCSLGSDGTLTVTHESGDRLDPYTLDLTDGSDWVSVEDDCNVADDVSAGDSFAVRVDADDTVRLTWTDQRRNSRSTTATLAVWGGED